MSEQKKIYISKYFDNNCFMVAGVCSKCFKEENDVKIVGVSRKLLNHRSEPDCFVKSKNSKVLFLDSSEFVQKLEEASSSKTNKISSETEETNEEACCKLEESVILDESWIEVNEETLKSEQSMTNLIKIEEENFKTTISNFKIEKQNCNIKEEFQSKYFKEEDSVLLPPGSQKPLWTPPKSPHNLIEESLYTNPWSLLVATIFLNKTSCYQAKPCIEEFLKDYNNPQQVLQSKPKDLEKYFDKIGLKKRSIQIWRMSHDFLHKSWKKAGELHGIGKYGEDAFEMFCRGNMNVEPNDRFLKIYKAWNLMKSDSCHCSK